jgi:hypothetical protein
MLVMFDASRSKCVCALGCRPSMDSGSMRLSNCPATSVDAAETLTATRLLSIPPSPRLANRPVSACNIVHMTQQLLLARLTP